MEQQLLSLIRSELCAPETDPPQNPIDLTDNDLLTRLYTAAQKHDLTHIVGAALMKQGLARDSAWYPIYRRARIAAITRYEQLHAELGQLCTVLTSLGVPYIPLKGSALRPYYPYPEMRTSCDIDILIRQDDLARITDALTGNAGYRRLRAGSHDVQFIAPSGVLLELHFTLIDEESYPQMQPMLSRVWEYTVPDSENSCQRTLTPEFAYFYHIAHMVKHYEYGGCGIRTVMDLWVYLHRAAPLDRAILDPMLEEAGIAVFESHMRTLCGIWFSDEQPTPESAPLYRMMQEYILTGGIYGSVKNRMALGRLQTGGKLRYLLSRLFAPYSRLKYEYPILQKHRLLLPFCQIHRWFRLLSRRTAGRIANELAATQALTADETSAMADMLHTLGLR